MKKSRNFPFLPLAHDSDIFIFSNVSWKVLPSYAHIYIHIYANGIRLHKQFCSLLNYFSHLLFFHFMLLSSFLFLIKLSLGDLAHNLLKNETEWGKCFCLVYLLRDVVCISLSTICTIRWTGDPSPGKGLDHLGRGWCHIFPLLYLISHLDMVYFHSIDRCHLFECLQLFSFSFSSGSIFSFSSLIV